MMNTFWNRARERRDGEGGFTLVELLVVVVIIGILVAIAIPVFLNQREKAWESAAESDLRNAAPIAETFYSDNGAYAGLSEPGCSTSDGVGSSASRAATATAYCIETTHTKLAGDVWSLDSDIGTVQNVAAPELSSDPELVRPPHDAVGPATTALVAGPAGVPADGPAEGLEHRTRASRWSR